MWADEITELNKEIREKYPNKTIWLYSGHTMESLMMNDSTKKLLDTVDVLVDGPFIEELKTCEIAFRGSRNQRILRKCGDSFIEASDSEFI